MGTGERESDDRFHASHGYLVSSQLATSVLNVGLHEW